MIGMRSGKKILNRIQPSKEKISTQLHSHQSKMILLNLLLKLLPPLWKNFFFIINERLLKVFFSWWKFFFFLLRKQIDKIHVV